VSFNGYSKGDEVHSRPAVESGVDSVKQPMVGSTLVLAVMTRRQRYTVYVPTLRYYLVLP
jgi:hypothetical protein